VSKVKEKCPETESNSVVKEATPQAIPIRATDWHSLRHPNDSVEGQLWERKHGHAGTKSSSRIRTHHTRLEMIGDWFDKH
jgi:hypothetical protein